nr:PREDICTED: uncharacterized protein LOC108953024 [Musa acuminata subsp. malaccensis]
MSSVALFFLLLSALSITACSARHLRMTAKDSDTSYHISNEAFPKVIVLDESPVQARTPQSSSSKGVADDPREDVEGKKGAVVSGREVPMPSFHAGLPQTTKSKARLEKRVRALRASEYNEEYVGSNETGVLTDVSSMDYPRAQRGPSIHNK